ncbi:MAG: sigma 54-interacting transcriptional regulator [Deltaproteobacteria bacterium]|nr:sigma 54-interacting transcriptional regulator [Deltaproteobacteria bacterium]
MSPLIGVSRAIKRINSQIKHVADKGLYVVITGEKGVGKDL